MVIDISKPLHIRVIPKASRNEVKLTSDGGMRIYITTVPENGKANKTVITLLAKHLGVAKSQLKITHGEKSKDKTIEVTQ